MDEPRARTYMRAHRRTGSVHRRLKFKCMADCALGRRASAGWCVVVVGGAARQDVDRLVLRSTHSRRDRQMHAVHDGASAEGARRHGTLLQAGDRILEESTPHDSHHGMNVVRRQWRAGQGGSGPRAPGADPEPIRVRVRATRAGRICRLTCRFVPLERRLDRNRNLPPPSNQIILRSERAFQNVIHVNSHGVMDACS